MSVEDKDIICGRQKTHHYSMSVEDKDIIS